MRRNTVELRMFALPVSVTVAVEAGNPRFPPRGRCFPAQAANAIVVSQYSIPVLDRPYG